MTICFHLLSYFCPHLINYDAIYISYIIEGLVQTPSTLHWFCKDWVHIEAYPWYWDFGDDWSPFSFFLISYLVTCFFMTDVEIFSLHKIHVNTHILLKVHSTRLYSKYILMRLTTCLWTCNAVHSFRDFWLNHLLRDHRPCHDKPSHGVWHDVDMPDIITVKFQKNELVEFADHDRWFDTLCAKQNPNICTSIKRVQPVPLGKLNYWKSNTVMKGTDRVSSWLLSLTATWIGAERFWASSKQQVQASKP